MRHRPRAPILVSILIAAALVAQAARAQRRTVTRSPPSPYEAETLVRALKDAHATIEPSPEGKTLEGVDVVPLDVIEDRDPAPSFLNALHTTTRESVLRREVLLGVGEPYKQYRVDETVRVLRSFQQLSLVLAVPIRGSAPDRVRLLLITKDVWSLRSQFDIRFGTSGLERFRIEPTERNIGGTLTSAVTRFELQPEALTFGAGYFVPRVVGKKLYLVTEANVVVNRASGDPEGTYGGFTVFRPLLSSDTPFTWSFGTSWSNVLVRRYIGAHLATYDDPKTPEVESAPDAFRARTMTQTAGVLRSLGGAYKTDLSVGAEVNVRDYVGLDPGVVGTRVADDYAEARVPRSDMRAGPFAQVRVYESRFTRIHDFDTLALGEDYRVGYDAFLRVYPVTKALGSSRNFFGSDAFAQYVVPVADGFLRATGESLVEVDRTGMPVLGLAASGAMVSPRFVFGRVIFDGVAIVRPENYLNARAALGGDGRLRGFPSQAFIGQNMIAWTTELRTRPVEVLSSQIGGVVFNDVGDAYDGPHITPKSSIGFGVRAVFPQLDRKVFRLDVAFPVVHGFTPSGIPNAGPVGFYVAFEQAFPPVASQPPGGVTSRAILSPTDAALGQ